MKRTKRIYADVTKVEHRKFMMKCIRNGKTMKEAVLRFVQETIKSIKPDQ